MVKQHGGRYVREGRWPVPARIELSTQLCRVTFDFTHAVITSGVLRIDADMVHGVLVIVSPPGIVIDTDGLSFTYSKVKVRPVTTAADPRLRIELARKLLHAKPDGAAGGAGQLAGGRGAVFPASGRRSPVRRAALAGKAARIAASREPASTATNVLAVQHTTTVSVTGPAGFLAELTALTEVYGAAMRAPREQLPGRRAMMERHAGYPQLRSVLVTADQEAGRLIAFCYGFRGGPGQWWHDVVQAGLIARLGATTSAAWLSDSFEVAEVHVLPAYQGRGIGRAMLERLMEGCQQRTALLSTQDTDSRARRLYARLGFADLLTGFCFPGGGPPYAVMGALLPLLASDPARGPSPSRW